MHMNVFLTPNPIGVLDRQRRGLKNINAYIMAIENGGIIIIPEEEEIDYSLHRYTKSSVMNLILNLVKEGFLDSLERPNYKKDKGLTKLSKKEGTVENQCEAHKEQLLAV